MHTLAKGETEKNHYFWGPGCLEYTHWQRGAIEKIIIILGTEFREEGLVHFSAYTSSMLPFSSYVEWNFSTFLTSFKNFCLRRTHLSFTLT